jgi:hypothetical protein
VRGFLFVLAVLISASLTAAGCGRGGGASRRPTPAELAGGLPSGSQITELVFADLTGDGRDEALAAATILEGPAQQLTAVVFESDHRGRYTQVLRRPLQGDTWQPVRVGRPGEHAPVAAVFAARTVATGNLAYLIVQPRGRHLSVTMENAGLLQGNVRFVSEGLLESRGDVDRLLRWGDSGWQTEELGRQYLPPVPTGTVTIEYTVDAVRGPMIAGPRAVTVRAGGHLFLRRMDRGDPSRVSVVGPPGAFDVGQDGIVTFKRADVLEVQIEGPAFSGRTVVIAVRVEQ